MDANTIVDSLPERYRWATEEETEAWQALSRGVVGVRVGGTDDDPHVDLAVREVIRLDQMDRCSGACDSAITVWDGEVCLCCSYLWGTMDGSGSCTSKHMPDAVFASAVDDGKFPEQPNQ